MRGEIFCVISKTMIYRGLGSGIIRVMNENVRVDFINEESASQFKTIIWRTIQNDAKDASNESKDASKDASNESKDVSNVGRLSKEELYDKIMDVCVDYISLEDIANAINKTLRYLKSKVIPKMVEKGLLERKYPDTPKHPQQQYRRRK